MQRNATEILNRPKQRIRWWINYFKARTKHIKRAQVANLSAYIPVGAVVCDIGANFGYVAKELCALHHGDITVYCFEPVPYTHSILERIMAPHKNARLVKQGLSNAAGITQIHIPVKPSGVLGFGISHMGAETNRDYIALDIPLTTLDAFASAENFTRLDFIKCDVEGAEMLVFQGGLETLKTFHPAIFCEVEDAYLARLGHTAQGLFDLLCGIGYHAYQMNELGEIIKPCDGQYLGGADYLFKTA